MRFLHLTLLYCMFYVFSADPALEYPSSPPAKILESVTTNSTTTNDVELGATNIILQSNDGGLTWQDISESLPEQEYPESFFAGESDLYLSVDSVMYRSKRNLKTPVWEKDNFPEMKNASLAFIRSGVVAYRYYGKIYERKSSSEEWLPVYPNLRKTKTLMIAEISNGTVFQGSDYGLFKSDDGGEHWKQVNDAWASEIVESEGVLMATSRKGIMRSTDNGDTWEWVISEGGVGIDVEKITGGFAAIVYNARTQSRRIFISVDGGKTWEARHDGLPPSKSISSIKQMGNYLICGHPDGIFRSSDMGKTWKRVHPAVEEFRYTNASMIETTRRTQPVKVFGIHVSGNTLYAVARNAGC